MNIKIGQIRLILVELLLMAGCQSYSLDENEQVEGSNPLPEVISIEDAVKSLDGFLELVQNNKTKSGEQKRYLPVQIHYSSLKTKGGNAIPDAYLINFCDNEGFAVLGANTNIVPVVAVVGEGNTTWDELLAVKEKSPSLNDVFEDEDTDEYTEIEKEYLEEGIPADNLMRVCVKEAITMSNARAELEILPNDDILKRDSFDNGPNEDLEDLENKENEGEDDLEEEETPVDSIEVSPGISPLLGEEYNFGQILTYCHKNNNKFVTNGCASTAISIIVAYNNFPQMIVDGEVLDGTKYNVRDGLGYGFFFPYDDIFVQVEDYFKNYEKIPALSKKSEMLNLIKKIDSKVEKKYDCSSTAIDQHFHRTRYKLLSATYYKMRAILRTWDATGVLPNAVSDCLESLHYSKVKKYKTKAIGSTEIEKIMGMLNDSKPIIVGGWTLSELKNSHYWVIDGIMPYNDDTLLHCNWGWGGSQNGWFSKDCLNSNESVEVTKTSNTKNEWKHFLLFTYEIPDNEKQITVNEFSNKHRVSY